MKVTRGQIITRGLTNRCPNCGARTLFKEDTLFQVNRECGECGLKIERANDEGFFLGSMSLNYGVTIAGFLVPVLVCYLSGVISGRGATILAGVGAIVFPILFYRSSRSWWLMNYYLVLPHHLPANQTEAGRGDDENL
jgi:endogenous inhibitor of DNA gyrase (YacG/DUF329 family)